MLLPWLLSAALASTPPDRVAALWSVVTDGAQIERMGVSPDERIVAGRSRGDLGAWLLDVETWDLLTFQPCDVTGVAPVDVGDGTWDLWVSCGDGTVAGLNWDGDTLVDLVDAEGNPFTYEVGTTTSGVWFYEGDEQLYVISPGEDGVLATVDVLDPYGVDGDEIIAASFPKDLPAGTEFNEAIIADDWLIVSHGGRDISTLQLSSPTALPRINNFSTLFDCDDMALSWTPSSVFCIDSLGQLSEFQALLNEFVPKTLPGLSEPNAVVADLELPGWVAVTGLQVEVFEADENGAIDPEPIFQSAEDVDNKIQDMVTFDGYVFGGGLAGNLHIVTARPWVYPGSMEVVPDAGTSGDVVELTFVVDTDTDWEILRGGDRTGSGVVLASGSSAAEEVVTVELTLDDGWDEGTNLVYVLATDDQGLTGHAAIGVFVDNPPDPPALTDANVGFADEALQLSFTGIDDEDLDRYEVYVSSEPFVADDWPTGGPEFVGSTNLKTPIVVQAAPGESVDLRIAPLENYVTYYIGVRAHDTGGLEGPMSKVVQGMPRPTFSASELAGETGGTPCSTSSGTAAGWLALGLGAVAALRRRSGALLAALVAVGLASPASAQTRDAERNRYAEDLTPTFGNFELRYGVVDLVDENIEDVYAQNPANILQVEFGPQLLRLFDPRARWMPPELVRLIELDVGFGFFQELSKTIDDAGNPASEITMLTWWPFTLDATARLQIIDEQILVPHARYGYDYVIWSEKWDDGVGGKETVRGGKFGSHYGVGVGLLLDVFAPARASLLEATSGINDSYLVFEWRRQVVDGRELPWGDAEKSGLIFDGDLFTVGLKLDY